MGLTTKQKLVGVGGTAIAAVATIVALNTTSSTIVVHNQKELYDAFRQAEKTYVSKIEVDATQMQIDSSIKVSGAFVAPVLIVDDKGCDMILSSDTIKAALIREPKDQTEALNSYQSKAVWFQNFVIHGKGKGIGIKYCAGYGGGVENSYFYSLGTSTRFEFVLMGVVRQCFATNCREYGFVFDNGHWNGAGVTNAQSNHSLFEQDRVFNADGATAAFAILGASGCATRQCISEGGRPKWHYVFKALGSTVVKDNLVDGFHIESPCDSSGAYWETAGGIMRARDLFSQYAMTLIEVRDDSQYPHIYVSDIPYTLATTKFKTSGNNVVWNISDVIAVPAMTDASRWVGGKTPYYWNVYDFNQSLTLNSSQGVINAGSLNVSSLKVNGKTIQ
jgi:hypothetical protein